MWLCSFVYLVHHVTLYLCLSHSSWDTIHVIGNIVLSASGHSSCGTMHVTENVSFSVTNVTILPLFLSQSSCNSILHSLSHLPNHTTHVTGIHLFFSISFVTWKRERGICPITSKALVGLSLWGVNFWSFLVEVLFQTSSVKNTKMDKERWCWSNDGGNIRNKSKRTKLLQCSPICYDFCQ